MGAIPTAASAATRPAGPTTTFNPHRFNFRTSELPFLRAEMPFRWTAVPLLLLWPAALSATPKYNPYTYTYATLGEGEVEIEQYVDLVPLKSRNATSGQA